MSLKDATKRFSFKERSNRSNRSGRGGEGNEPKFGKAVDDQVLMLEKMHQFTDRLMLAITQWLKVHGVVHSTVGSSMTRPDALADAVNRLGQRVPQATYSRVLLSTAEIEKRISGQQRKFQREIEDHVLMPLKQWVKQDYSLMKKAVDSLDSKRKDLVRATRDLKAAGVTQAPDNPLEGPPEELEALKKLQVSPLAAVKHNKFCRAVDTYKETKELVIKHLQRLPEFRTHHESLMKQLIKSWQELSSVTAKTTDQYASFGTD